MADTANLKINIISNSEDLAQDAARTATSYKSVESSLAKAAASSTRIARPAAAARRAAQMENQEYGVARGTTQTTGAAGRDFANQAQGLGGLVHLYATFAANIFAAGAAFRALSSAMDTTNMVKGLDQLGAASGRNLGSLAKSLAMVSDGAISLREAMEATAKASSAGLSSDQIMRMGTIAKNASQALGVAMPDAISRLSRGISKIEPELLDELGIYVKVDQAVREYARSMGKTATSLSDFERRQAYATAVLKEGEQKFSAISIESNSYSKLLASLANIAQKAGESINTILGPAAKLFADNTGLLTAALAGIVGMLLNRAIPAMAQWRKNLKESAEIASQKAKAITTSFGERFVERTEATLNIPQLKAEFEKAKIEAAKAGKAAAEARSEAFKKGVLASNSSIYKAIQAQGAEAALSPDVLKKVKESSDKLADNAKENLRLRGEQLRLIDKTATAELSANEKLMASEKALRTAQDNAVEAASVKVRKYSQEWQRYEIARKAAAKAERLTVLASVAQATKEGGIGEGFKALKEGVTDSKTLTGLDKLRTRVVGTFTIMTSAVTTFLSSINQIFFYIGIAVAVFKLLDSWLTNTAKEAEETSRQLENLSSSTENLSKTMDLISKKDPLEQLSPDSLNAKYTALSGLSDAMVKAVAAAQDELSKMSWWDVSINWIKSWWGGDVQSKLNEALASSLAESFKALSGSSAEIAAKEQIKKLIDITDESKEGITKALEQAVKINPAIYDTLIQKQKELSKSTAESAAKMKELKEAHITTTKAIKDYLNSLIPKDPMSEFASNIIAESKKINEALRDPFTSIGATLEGLRNLSDLQPLSSVGDQFRTLAIDMEKTIAQYQEITNRTQTYREELNKLTKELDINNKKWYQAGPAMTKYRQGHLTNRGSIYGPSPIKTEESPEEQVKRIQSLDKEIKQLDAASKDLEVKIKNAGVELLSASYKIFDEGVKLLSNKAAQEFAKANSVYLTGLASLLGETEAAIDLQLEADKANIAAQKEVIQSQINLALQTERSSLATEALRISIDKQVAELKLQQTDTSTQGGIRKFENIQQEISKLIEQADQVALRKFSLDEAYAGNKAYLDTLKAQAKTQQERATYEYAIEQYLKVQFALAQKAGLDAQLRVKELESAVKLVKVRNDIEAKRIDNELKSLSVQEQQLAAIKSFDSIAGVMASRELMQLDIRKTKLEIDKEVLTANTKITAQEMVRDKLLQQGRTEQAKKVQAEIDRLTITRDITVSAKEQEGIQRQISSIIDINNKNLAIQLRLTDEINKIESATVAFLIEQNGLEQSLLNAKNSGGVIAEQVYINEKSRLELIKEELNYRNQVNQLTQQQEKTISELENRRANALAQARSLPTDTEAYTEKDAAKAAAIKEEVKEINRLLALNNSNYSTAIDRLATIFDNKKKIIGITKELELRTEKWNSIFKEIAASTVSLAALFGEMGTKIGLATEVFAKLGQVIETNALKEQDALARVTKAREEAEASRDETTGAMDEEKIKKVGALQEAYDKQRRKSAKDEISAAAATAGAVKNLFKEKTAAYKAFAALEKTLHVARLAYDVIEMASTLRNLGTTLAAFLQEKAGAFGTMIVDGAKAVVKAISGLPFPLNLAAGAATAAAVAAVISSVGGSGGPAAPPASGFTAKEQQEVQGTGYAWDRTEAGKKVETGYGIYGDPEAKIENIDKSLEIVRDRSIDFLPIFNEMVSLLDSIDKGIRNTATSLYGLTDLRTGTMFGPMSTSKLTSGIPSILGGGLLDKLYEVPVLGKALSFISSKKVDKNITDFGIALGDATTSFYDLANSVNTLSAYSAGTQTTTRKVLGIKISSKTSNFTDLTPLKDIDPQVAEGISSIFKYAQDLFISIGERFGRSAEETIDKLRSVKITESIRKISLEGLTGEDLEKEVSAVIGEVLNIAADSLFAFAKQYRKFGEDILTTVIRIVDTNDKVVYALKNIGIDYEKKLSDIVVRVPTADFITETAPNIEGIKTNGQVITQAYKDVTITVKEQSLKVTEALVDMAGGMEEFAKGINFYMENFLTEEERRALLTKQVTEETTRLKQEFGGIIGNETLDSIDGFKKIIQKLGSSGAILTTEGQQLYTALMNLGPAFHELYAAGSSAEEAANKIRELTAQLYRLQGRTDEAIAIERSLALEQLNTEEEKTLQQQIWLLEDELKLRKLDVDLLTAQGRTYEALLATREEELRTLTESERVIKRQIYAAQDWQKTVNLELQGMKLRGQTTAALAIEREQILKTLSDVRDLSGYSDRDRQQEIWALEDAAKLRALETELLTAQGFGYQALLRTRQEELRTLTVSQQVIKKQIYAAQDQMKTYNLGIQLMRAMGNETGALAAERALELRNLSETDQEIQKLIWMYEDQAEANDKLKDSIQGVIDSLKDNIRSLEEYKKSLRISDQSPLSTAAKYNETRNTINDLLQTISTPAVTDEQKQAQSNAVQKLQETSTTFLDLSRKLFSSTGQYNTDFDWILSIIDTATGSLEKQLTDAEKQLAATELTNVELKTLNETALKLLSTISMPGSNVTLGNIDSFAISDPIVDKLSDVGSIEKQQETITKLETLVESLGTVSTIENQEEMISKLAILSEIAEKLGIELEPGKDEEITSKLEALSLLGLALSTEKQDETNFKLETISLSLAAANDKYAMFADNLNTGVNSIITSLGAVIQDTFVSQVNNLQTDTRNIEAAVYNTNNNNTPLLQAMVDQLKVLNEKVALLEQATIDIGLMNVEATKENTDKISSTVIEGVSTNLYNQVLQNKAMIA